MHGMLSAAVMLAAFALVALAAAASVVWVYRAAGAAPPRSRPAPAGLPADAAGPDTPAAPDVAGPGRPDEPAGPGRPDEPAGPDQAAAPEVAVDVYDIEEWAGPDEPGDLDGVASRGPGGWPNPSKSLYSRGWPAMDSPAAGRDAADAADRQEPDGQAPGAQEARRTGNPAEGRVGLAVEDVDDVLYGISYEEQGGQDRGRQEPGGWELDRRGLDAGGRDEPEPGRQEAPAPEAAAPEAAAPEAAEPGHPEGARVYVLGESRRRGR
jgi:hypothetical protein